MNEDKSLPVEMRKIQEAQENLLNAGGHKLIAQWHYALYKAYIVAGFNEEQALDLLKTYMNNHL